MNIRTIPLGMKSVMKMKEMKSVVRMRKIKKLVKSRTWADFKYEKL